KGSSRVKAPPAKSPPPNNESDELSIAIDLLREILKSDANQNRRYCTYCQTKMAAPLELHHKDCVWRRAWELVSTRWKARGWRCKLQVPTFTWIPPYHLSRPSTVSNKAART